ncbi:MULTISPECIES: thioredoxin domain-containing protein [unclassified Actinotalea]|uniref:DsbA family protein n=1 Tax=unclassified Actinotalea TaxID=2638618 RepID=UPI0015F3C80D|nr:MULTISPECIES: thioredoxin domain-containing protein [unclassified Actinotalea]
MSSTTPPRPTKAARRDEARAEALRLREEQQRQAQRQRTIVISLLVVGLVVVGGLIWWIMSMAQEDQDFAEVEQPLAGVSAPAAANDEGGIRVGEDGVARDIDVPEDAVVVTVYADFMCPICGQFEQVNGADLDELREAGEVVVEYRPVSILDRFSQGSQFSTRSATALALVADRAPEAFLGFNQALFASQPAEGTSGLSDEQIAELAEAAGVPQDVTRTIADGSYMEGEDSFAPWVAAATEQASRDFAPQFGTPTVLVDGENVADQQVDWRVPGALVDVIEKARG